MILNLVDVIIGVYKFIGFVNNETFGSFDVMNLILNHLFIINELDRSG